VTDRDPSAAMTNGPAGAAILAAGLGCCMLGVLACAAERSRPLAQLLTFYQPTGPLSGVSSAAILSWLATWFILARRWRVKTVALAKINLVSFVLLGLGLLLTFPPFMDCLPGR
jgi:hypothetical protein